MDLEDIEIVRSQLKMRGAQGTTGTQASFMSLFNDDGDKIDKLNEILTAKAGFPSGCYNISTQTYTVSNPHSLPSRAFAWLTLTPI
jgi:adenylosuccinate lyase